MDGQKWKRKEYDSWDEAFRGLSPIIRQQSVRVAAYTRALFLSACALHFEAESKEGEERIRGVHADLAYKCGLYHQIGKSLVPPEYQILQADFTDEELGVYKKYTTDGRLLTARLQEKSTRAKEKRKGILIEVPTNNIPWLMLRESCEQHMERYDGSGFPAGREGQEISPIAQIVGLAKELDRIASETKSEKPFDIAMQELRSGADTLWSAALMRVLDAAEEECRGVYEKYIAYTRTIPKTIPLVVKTPDRPLKLRYRPMVSDPSGTVLMYEATPRFGGIADQPGETEGAADLRELIKRTGLCEELSWYFLYEATDALYRLKNCKLELRGILLNMLPDFYSLKTQLQKFNKLFEDQPVERNKLWLTVPSELIANGAKTHIEILQRYIRSGIKFVVDGYRPDSITVERLKELGLTCVRLDPELYLQHETADEIIRLKEQGIEVIGGSANDADVLNWLIACGTLCSSGVMTGSYTDEDEMILDSLARESKLG